MTGSSVTIAYSNAGAPLWTNVSGGNTAIAVDARGSVFVTGGSVTIAYSNAGVPLWTNVSGGSTEIAVDGNGKRICKRGLRMALGADYATIKYSNAGVPLWTNRYNGLGNSDDNAYALVVDRNGDVVVTGSSVGNRTGADYVTIKYSSAGPLLTIARTTTNTLALSWASPAADFTLQQNTNVASTNWMAVGTTPADDGTNKTIIVDPADGNGFYRLFRP